MRTSQGNEMNMHQQTRHAEKMPKPLEGQHMQGDVPICLQSTSILPSILKFLFTGQQWSDDGCGPTFRWG